MEKKSNEYWQKRFEALEEAQNRKGNKYYAGLKKQYTKAASAVQRDIETWYGRFAINNQITLQEARKMLTKNELEEFHWNVMDYIAKGRENAINHQWEKQLENASAKWHISRLEALKIQMQNHVEQLYDGQQLSMADFLVDVYTDNYYHTAYEIQKGFNVGYDLMRLDMDKIEKVVSKPWAADGSNFSDRIWKHKAQLVSELHNGLTQGIIRGQDSKALIEHISKRFEVSMGQAARLVMTETAFVQSASTRDSYKELDVEEYEIVATLDRKTSELCQDMDGKHFPLSQYEIGATAPPFHVWCRTTTVPYFDDEFELDAERAARGDDGSTYFVPANMKYSEWKEKFVDGGSKEGLKVLTAVEIADIAQQTIDLPQEEEKVVENSTKEAHNIAEGKDVVGEWQRRTDEYANEIDDIIDFQGFNGKPQIMNAEDFEEAMKKSGFYAERTYSANTQELLDEYREELYGNKGKAWYVNCDKGGSDHGQGMYCAATYDINDEATFNGIAEEMKHYQELNAKLRHSSYFYTEGITLDTSARIIKKNDVFKTYLKNHKDYFGFTDSDISIMSEYMDKAIDMNKVKNQAMQLQLQNWKVKDPAVAKQIQDLMAEANKKETVVKQLRKAFPDGLYDRYSELAMKDRGVMAAEMGFDAINAEEHGQSGSYTVILNRTKVIFKEGGVLHAE